jgi:predicted nucleic acid-binding protein
MRIASVERCRRALNGGATAAAVRGPVAWTADDQIVVDCRVVLHLASEGIEVPAEHELLAPTLLRSQTLSALHEAVHAGEIAPDVALDRLTRIRAMPIRLLGDAVLRRRAWDLAEQLGWAETYDAEYVALTQLQADALVTLDPELARRVEGIVPTATIEALRTAYSCRGRDSNPHSP